MHRHLIAMLLLSLASSVLAQGKPVGLPVNTAADEDNPHVSSSQTSLYYASNSSGKFDIYLSQRKKQGQPWGPGKAMDDYVNTDVDDRSAFATADGRFPQYFFYATQKDKEINNFDLFVAQRIGVDRVFSAPTPLNTICTEADELHPWLTINGRSLYFSRKTRDGWRVFVATRKETTGAAGFGEPTLVKELPVDFHHPTLTADGKMLYLQGPRGEGRWGIFRSTWNSSGWSVPKPLEKLNQNEGKRGDVSPNLSRDGNHLYFASDRPGGKGGLDLYVIPTAQLDR